MYNVVGGVRKLSTSWELFFVGHPLADTIGLPGDGILPLCSFSGGRALRFYILYQSSSNLLDHFLRKAHQAE